MQHLATTIEELNRLVLAGRPLEAFDKFYHDEVVMQENENAPTIGKPANRMREETFFSNIIEFREAKPLTTAVGENVTMVVWHYDYTHKDWGVRNYTQASIQTWENGKIIREQFFYGS